MTQLSFDSGAEHAHLRLTRTLDPMPRYRPPGGGRRGPGAPDARSHARNLSDQLNGVQDRYRGREPVLGITPELVMVIEVSPKAIDVADIVEQADLEILGLADQKALVAFASDPDLASLNYRLNEYATALTDGGNPRYWNLLDPIVRIRPLEPDDVIDDDLQAHISGTAADDVLRVDIECWCTDERSDTERRHQETLAALQNAGAEVLDRSCRHEVGFSLIRADISAGKVRAVARTDRVSRISLLPRAVLSQAEVRLWTDYELPAVLPPDEGAPTVAIIDSGVRTGHPLLAPAVVDTVSAVPHLPDGSDEHGHGSMVASLALYGQLERLLHTRTPLKPAGHLFGIRVLDRDNYFPKETLWQTVLEQAVADAVSAGARVINISLGDPAHPYRPPAPTAIAAALDRLAREGDVVLVISAGNVHAEEHTEPGYAAWLLSNDETTLAPPAMSALALTVGALVPDAWQGARPYRETVTQRQLGQPGEPSPISRTGPGIEYAIKPDVTAPGGTYVHDRDEQRVRAANPSGTVVGISGADPERLLELDRGTSFAAPLVSHAALRVFGRYPQLSANAVRALVLASVSDVPTVVQGNTDNDGRRVQRWLSGFGRVIADRAEVSSEHRVVLLGEQALAPDQVHFYDIPVPESFFNSGNKLLTVTLAFDPETRGTRLKYLASRMSVFIYRGRSVDEVQAKFTASGGEPPDGLDNAKVDLSPSDRDRLLGANQAASATWSKSWKRKVHDNLVVVVRNTSRWPYPQYQQRYALAVVLEVDEQLPPIYAELHARFEALAEIEPQIEPEIE